MRGLPQEMTIDQLLKFFNNYGLMTGDDVYIHTKKTVKYMADGIAVFESEEMAQKAKVDL